MKLLYLSRLEDESFAGLTYSVPSQVKSQSIYDTVHWYNFLPTERDSWRDTGLYHNSNDYEFDIKQFIKECWKPDLIIFEGFYAFHPTPRIIEIISSGIPYVIVPRCAFTEGDQAKKALKKKICNFLFYRGFANRAKAIQYLTEKEATESGSSWNEHYFIQPNGIDEVACSVRSFNRRKKREIVYIGRIEPYQKGLDLLMDAISCLKDESGIADKVHISIYGNSANSSAEKIKVQIEGMGVASLVSLHGPVYGESKIKVLEEADVFLLTSRYEGMPMGLLEACSFGLPCIVTPGTNMADDVQREKAGWICGQSAESINAALLNAAGCDKEEMRALSLGSKRIAARYSWNSIARDTHDE